MPLGHSTIRDSCLRLGWKVVFPIGCIQGRLFYTTVWSSHRMAEIHSHFLTSCFGALDRGCNDGTTPLCSCAFTYVGSPALPAQGTCAPGHWGMLLCSLLCSADRIGEAERIGELL